MAIRNPNANEDVIVYDKLQTDEINRLGNRIDVINNHYISPLTLHNGWTQVSSWGPVQSETRSGIILVTGLVNSGEAGSLITILPVSQRPNTKLRFVCGGAGGVTLIDVFENGEVTHISGGVINVSLSNIIFTKR